MNKQDAARAIGLSAYDDADYFHADDMVQTRDTLADFIEAQGKPDHVSPEGVHSWERRKTLRVIDGGEFRFAINH